MGPVAVKFPVFDDVLFMQLARELAMDISELDTILKRYQVTDKDWEKISTQPRFVELLKGAVVEWQSAVNTEQRVKIKSATLLEMWLEEANQRLHDRSESLAAKTELAKFLGRLAGMGLTNTSIGDVGEKITISINLGADTQLKFEKPLPARVIEHDPTQENV